MFHWSNVPRKVFPERFDIKKTKNKEKEQKEKQKKRMKEKNIDIFQLFEYERSTLLMEGTRRVGMFDK